MDQTKFPADQTYNFSSIRKVGRGLTITVQCNLRCYDSTVANRQFYTNTT